MLNEDHKIKELTPLQNKIIILLNRGFNTSDIEKKSSLKRRNIIKEYHKLLINGKTILTEKEYKIIRTEYLSNLCFTEFPEGEIVIISDTHLASKYENLEYLKQVKEFLRKNNIKYLLHGGDIGDGMVEEAEKYSTYTKQLDHILDVYDLGNTTSQYILGGNHDAKYKRKNSNYDILNLLEENNVNIEAIGYYQAYFKLGTIVISFEHNSYYDKFIGRDFSILGHSHNLKFKESAVNLPTLSDNFPNSQNTNIPGFVVLNNKIKNNCTRLEFTNYKTTDNGIEKGKVKKYIFQK